MKNNIGLLDRNIRLVLAMLLAVLYFTKVITGTLAIVLLVLIFILLTTSVVRFCPLYFPFGIITKEKSK